MSTFRTLRASATAAPAIAAIRKPLRARLTQVCSERGESLEVVAANEVVMGEVFQYVWNQFPASIRQAVDRNFFIQSCLKERHRLIGDAAPGTPKKPLMQRLRERSAAKKSAS